MHSTELRIDGQSFLLSADEDLDALRARISDAVARGAGFVDFTTVRGEGVSVLLSGRSSVLITIQQHRDDEPAAGLSAMMTDPDLYSLV
ncbi:hypothetical protein QFZ62_001789 [Clavibacter sp. B3I6]|uniref:hypothetical protein n=1 Tax=Clavibacter sp. B3I6 TaxID=3042268 RepID=UPI002789B182|nr:hypothetical protein [Clavibacter sp. B3I6]MDQ0744481.1 hypothetical protein [Clavibacter sp. B3I6]